MDREEFLFPPTGRPFPPAPSGPGHRDRDFRAPFGVPLWFRRCRAALSPRHPYAEPGPGLLGDTKAPGDAGLRTRGEPGASGGGDAAAPVQYLGFQLGLQGLDLTEHREAPRRTAQLVLQHAEDLLQPLGRGPEGRVFLSGGSVLVHAGSMGFLDNMIMFAADLGQ